jgi:hypothetical protein
VSGAIQSFIDQTAFVVRGMSVSARSLPPISGLSNGYYVTVTGYIQEDILVAVTVDMPNSPLPDRAVLMFEGLIDADGQSMVCDAGKIKLQFDAEQSLHITPGQRISLEGYWNAGTGALEVKGHPNALEALDDGAIPVSGILDAVDQSKGLLINGRWIQVDAEELEKWQSKQGKPIDLSIIRIEDGPEKGLLKAKPRPPVK